MISRRTHPHRLASILNNLQRSWLISLTLMIHRSLQPEKYILACSKLSASAGSSGFDVEPYSPNPDHRPFKIPKWFASRIRGQNMWLENLAILQGLLFLHCFLITSAPFAVLKYHILATLFRLRKPLSALSSRIFHLYGGQMKSVM